ncbi:guanitoxin biosynthesis heme-dependent pre-guanitoxin N-hydroxylase GntA [Gelidibacter sp.]|uniref:guanitoxin biosynthesis heme-dependent pre-guanitoxin N-hydroxylase GntA n=1 Tax=Gelidibacter sp. TaxID=2018083 RepID=UPI002CE358A2|nr:guanitoxin biosynthesis heme-dependent pre-guanitoxin N-hydroxylase GntA [Gelidibacter sp.]HUH26609.1 guanitoxin biosynthesis heme-dependent pre-guanitoxin N-hydroxylase GntA [Gelidibacter sp.]
MEKIDQKENKKIELAYENFFIKQKHPCIMANAVFKLNKYHLKVYDDMSSDRVVKPILKDIENYLDQYDFESNDFESLLLCFKDSHFETEMEFEKSLWNLLQKLHDHDHVEWDHRVSDDVESPTFSFSLKGRAFYIIGMHPQSSRLARRAPYCTLVMNLHWQFEKLREMGTYQTVKNRIRRRDKKLQGSINPVLKDFGKESEAKQYSGRAVDKDWKCPFHIKQENI